MVEIIKRVTIVGQSQGLEKAAADLRGVTTAQQELAGASKTTATITEMSSRRQLSAAGAYDRMRSSLDAAYRSQQQFARGQAVLDRAFEQGLVDAQEQVRMLGLLEAKYNSVGMAAARSDIVPSIGRASSAMQNLRFQLFDIAQAVPLAFQSPQYALQAFAIQGGQIVQAYAGQGGVSQALKDTASIAGGLVSRLWPIGLAFGAGAAAIAGMTSEINELGGATVTFGDTALATWQLVSEGVSSYIKPAVDSIVGWLGGLWGMVAPGVVMFGNRLVGTVVGAVESIQSTVKMIPDALTVAGQLAAQGFIDSIVWMAREAIVIVNSLITDINGLAMKAGLKPVLGLLPPPVQAVPRPVIDIGGGDAAASIAEEQARIAQRLQEIGQTDYLGGMFSSIAERAQELARAREAVEGIGTAATGSADAMRGLRDETSAAARELEREFQEAQRAAIGRMDEFRGAARGVLSSFVRDGPGAALDTLSDKLLNLGENLAISGLLGANGQIGGAIFGETVTLKFGEAK